MPEIIDVLNILVKEKDDIEKELRSRGETNLRFYDALDGTVGIISDYKANLDEIKDKSSDEYLHEKLGNNIQLNHSSDSLLTELDKTQAEKCPYNDLQALVKLFRENIVPASLGRVLLDSEVAQIDQISGTILVSNTQIDSPLSEQEQLKENLKRGFPGLSDEKCIRVIQLIHDGAPDVERDMIRITKQPRTETSPTQSSLMLAGGRGEYNLQ